VVAKVRLGLIGERVAAAVGPDVVAAVAALDVVPIAVDVTAKRFEVGADTDRILGV